MIREIRHLTLEERVYRELRNLILSGEYHPGERLLYQHLAEVLGVSQTPIKGALAKLESDGYVMTISRKGTFVRELSARDIAEIFEIREMLEALAVRRICRCDSVIDYAHLKEINESFREGFSRKDLNASTEADYRFHETLIILSGNGRLVEVMNKTNVHLLSIARSSSNFYQIARGYYQMHNRIVDALEKQDAALAERLMREHVRYGMEQVLMHFNSSAKPKRKAKSDTSL